MLKDWWPVRTQTLSQYLEGVSSSGSSALCSLSEFQTFFLNRQLDSINSRSKRREEVLKKVTNSVLKYSVLSNTILIKIYESAKRRLLLLRNWFILTFFLFYDSSYDKSRNSKFSYSIIPSLLLWSKNNDFFCAAKLVVELQVYSTILGEPKREEVG